MCMADVRSRRLRGALITPEGVENLRTYKYSGADLSLLYKYCLSPLAERCLQFLPMSMAPNLVTLLGLIMSAISYVLLFLYAPGLQSSDTPGWVFLVTSVGLFLYQTLDNMDGKQARRTGSSSPLGLIFDHGCDALNQMFGIVYVACLLNAGSSLAIMAAIMGNQTIPFFFATWEEYYTHELLLPIVNGPSEGVVLGVMAGIATCFLRPEWWWEPNTFLRGLGGQGEGEGADGEGGVGVAYVLLGGSLAGAVVTMLVQTANVLRLQARKGRSLMAPLVDIGGFASIWLVGGAWLLARPGLYAAGPHAVIALFGLLNVELLVTLMLCHTCGMVYQPFRPILAPLLLGWANSCAFSSPPVDEVLFIRVYLAGAAAYVSLYLVRIVREVADALGIYVFRLGPRRAGGGGGGSNGRGTGNGNASKPKAT